MQFATASLVTTLRHLPRYSSSTRTAEGESTFQDMGFKARMSVKASANRRKEEWEGTKEKKKSKAHPSSSR